MAGEKEAYDKILLCPRGSQTLSWAGPVGLCHFETMAVELGGLCHLCGVTFTHSQCHGEHHAYSAHEKMGSWKAECPVASCPVAELLGW